LKDFWFLLEDFLKITRISLIRKQGKDSGFRANETHHGVTAEMAALAPGTVQLYSLAWNHKLTKYVKDGQLQKAMQLFQQMQREETPPDRFTFVPVIRACAGLGRLEEGRSVHVQII